MNILLDLPLFCGFSVMVIHIISVLIRNLQLYLILYDFYYLLRPHVIDVLEGGCWFKLGLQNQASLKAEPIHTCKDRNR